MAHPVLATATLFSGLASALVAKDGLAGRLPAMGWNSWNTYGCNINESVFLKTAQQMENLGLRAAGYQYVNIDDCWSDNQKRRDSSGKILPDLKKFPNGISGLVEKIHEQGLKVGIYSDAGNDTASRKKQ
jgi:alpha-galactosidase